MSTTQPSATPVPLPLPEALNPDALDVLSELAHLLSRLRALPGTGASSTSTSQPPGTTPLQATATPTPTALLSSQASSRKNGGGGELSLKEIPMATDALKHRFQRARNLVKTSLPDLDRDIAAQEVEIKALEARIARQRDTLVKLREVGERLAVVQGEGDGDKMEE
ncbi:RNA polymerase II transcription mediator complex subunit 9-domain-containing protein [Xylaria venustula]|nr:RNA polymerase II transcription mediator complex subunit 9-domain-containing protein [Xylaria venustula]